MRLLSVLLISLVLHALPAHAMGPFHENPPEVVEGMAALAAGKPQEALDAFDAAKARLGSRPELEHNRALAMAELGRREDAAAIFKELSEDPSLSRELRAKSAYNLGNVHAAGSARKEALAAYRRALTLNPGDEDARHNLEVLLRNVPPKQEAPADGGQDTPDGGEPEDTGEDGGTDGGNEDGESDGGEEDGGQGDRPKEEGDTDDGGEGEEDGLDGGEDGEQEGGTPEDGGEDPGSSDSEDGEQDAGSDGGDEQGDAGDSSEQGPDAGDAGAGDAGEDAGDDPAEGEGEDGDAGTDGGEGSPEGDPEDADAGSESGSGAGREAPEPSEGEQEGISAQEAESMLDAMKQDERNLQLWRFQGRKRPRDANQKDW